jgi:methylmalonyl-CoA epimerase
LGIAVASIDEALVFYRDALGLEVTHRTVVKTEKVEAAMLPAGEPRIELLQPTEPDSPIGRFLERKGEGLHHVAVEVQDLDAAVARLKAAGARLASDEARIGAEGYRYVFVHPKSAGGVLLELIEQNAGQPEDHQTSPSTSS